MSDSDDESGDDTEGAVVGAVSRGAPGDMPPSSSEEEATSEEDDGEV